MLWAQAEDVLKPLQDNWILAAVAVGVLVAALVLLKIARSRKKPPPDLETGLREDLKTYPAAPSVHEPRRLSVNGIPGRLRLIVLAPTGKTQENIMPDHVAELLNNVVRGLGAFVVSDKPRIKVWPPQLSIAGFAPTFHRLVESPDAADRPSRWVKLAGPARTGKRPILLGLAIYADELCQLGDVNVETTEWGELLEVPR
jgi:hypothetical protein